ncbi:MAG: large conductance mechanosensitive channel protein MscL [Acidimicrobiia bacterium]
MGKFAKDFRDFIMRGNVLDLAVAVVIGAAFNAVVTSMVNDIIMPIVAGIIGKPSFDDLTFSLGDATVFYGKFLTALVNFLIIAATIFVIIRAFESLQNRRSKGEVEEPAAIKTDEVIVLEQIRDLLAERSAG